MRFRRVHAALLATAVTVVAQVALAAVHAHAWVEGPSWTDLCADCALAAHAGAALPATDCEPRRAAPPAARDPVPDPARRAALDLPAPTSRGPPALS